MILLIGNLSCLNPTIFQGFLHPRLCRRSSINPGPRWKLSSQMVHLHWKWQWMPCVNSSPNGRSRAAWWYRDTIYHVHILRKREEHFTKKDVFKVSFTWFLEPMSMFVMVVFLLLSHVSVCSHNIYLQYSDVCVHMLSLKSFSLWVGQLRVVFLTEFQVVSATWKDVWLRPGWEVPFRTNHQRERWYKCITWNCHSLSIIKPYFEKVSLGDFIHHAVGWIRSWPLDPWHEPLLWWHPKHWCWMSSGVSLGGLAIDGRRWR